MKITKKQVISMMVMFLVAFIWGTSFAAQTDSSAHIKPLTFIVSRAIIGTVSLGIIVLIRNAFSKKTEDKKEINSEKSKKERKKLIFAGSLCGLALAFAWAFQQWGIWYNEQVVGSSATSGKAGFLTALYIVFIPLFGLLFKRKVTLPMWIGAIAAFAGMYILCLMGVESRFTLGDIILILCAVAYAIHIMIVDHFCAGLDTIKVSLIQTAVGGLLLTPVALIWEGLPDLTGLISALPSVIYLGVFSTAIGFTAQISVQKHLHPVLASLIMSFESVFAALAGAVILDEKMTSWQYIACIIIFFGTMIAQFGDVIMDKLKKNKSREVTDK